MTLPEFFDILWFDSVIGINRNNPLGCCSDIGIVTRPCFCGNMRNRVTLDSGIRFNDPDIGVEWPVERVGGWDNVITSEKDSKLQSFREFVDRHQVIE